MNHRYLACTLLLALLAGPAVASELQDHSSIRTTAEGFIAGIVQASHGSEPEVRAGALDSRLRLARCDSALEAFQANGSSMLGNTTVGVRCNGSTAWTLYVPVNVSLYGDVVVAARPLARNHLLTASDLKLARRDLAQLHAGYYSHIDQLVGKQAGRNIALDTAISTLQVKEPLTVKRGQRVKLVATAGGLEVRMAGEAMANGTTGERIKVRNLSSKRIIDGIIKSATTVQVPM